MKYIYLIALLFITSPLLVSAHPGNTDSSGGHNCRTNCDSWGVPWNQWHSHSGNSYRPPSSFPTQTFYTPPVSTYKMNSDCPSYGFAYMGSCYELPANAKKSAISGFYCAVGYSETGFGLSKKCVVNSSDTYSYSSSNFSSSSFDFSSLNSCPKNSSEDPDDSDRCICKLGYEPNKDKDACKKISKKTNEKLCRASFGKNSIWTGKYDKKAETPTCNCKKGFVWNTAGDSCVK